ncbi:MAG: hypothetical protein IJV46_01795 [Acidaminococcaceae bacterium]|nr:hypothetical protein [Acidaminococcaceae bacterium]
MKKLITCISVLVSLLVFFSTAYADVADPYGRPRPHRPELEIPVTKEYKIRPADFEVVKGEKENTFLLQITLPGPCDWRYTIQNDAEAATFESETFANFDFNKERETREISLLLPEPGKTIRYIINVGFDYYRYTDTRFGPKLIDKNGNRTWVAHEFRLEEKDGQYLLIKL